MLTFQLHEEVPPSPFAPSCPGNESSGPHGPPVDPVLGKQVSAQLKFDPLPAALPHATMIGFSRGECSSSDMHILTIDRGRSALMRRSGRDLRGFFTTGK